MATLNIKPKLLPEEVAKIPALENRMWSVMTGGNNAPMTYEDTNKASHTDHRVEVQFMMIAQIVNALQSAKNVHYDNSWSKRGVYSMAMNMERKWERLAKQIFDAETVNDAASETFMDTAVDLAAYAMKFVAWVAARRPDIYLQLLQNVEAECLSVGMLQPVVMPADRKQVVQQFNDEPDTEAIERSLAKLSEQPSTLGLLAIAPDCADEQAPEVQTAHTHSQDDGEL